MPSNDNGIAAGRLRAEDYAANFRDIRPPLDPHQPVPARLVPPVNGIESR